MKTLPPPPLPGWLEKHVPFRRILADLGDWKMHVMQAGEGFPVLLLHGNPMWGFLYRRVAAALAGRRLRLIMPDLLGLGFSDRPAGSWHSLARHAHWVGRLIDGLGLDRALLVCHDWGGPIGLRAFADRPDRLAGLVVLNTVADAPKPGFRPTRFHRFSNLPIVSEAAFRLLGFPQNALHRVQANPSSIRGAVARAYRYPLRGLRRNAAPLALARMVPTTLDHPSVADLRVCGEFARGLRIPSAIVWGDRDPVLGGAFKRMLALLPEARVTRTEAGHYPQEEVPEEIAAAVLWVFERAVRTDETKKG